MLEEFNKLAFRYLVNPFAGRSDPDAYTRAYMETCQQTAVDIKVAGNEKLIEALTMLLNMALGLVNVFSRAYALKHVVDAPDRERAKIIQCSRFVVEHASMFPETYVPRSEKFALSVKFQDEIEEDDKWQLETGRHYAEAFETLIWDEVDDPPAPYVQYGRGKRAFGLNKLPKRQTGGAVLVVEPSAISVTPIPHSNIVALTRDDLGAWRN